ncbi:MAG TPA: DNA polymerase III subunit gamma/tau [Candidatus Saccharimonadales bacterium]|nr:DNA polymerase III subunit gamma/tau [Candidatus Saccharimonadales bacterium]
MGQALYRRYRSKKLSELVGQEHITTALGRALTNGTIAHAYLFTGPRGTGKTSIARILAHEVNGLPYDDESYHLDIIEIDAASNRRIDEIRDLRDKVHIAPASAKFKVYIIDEVHMLTKEAFNALLKTLEEPPAHVIFILATTEVHKLPETIISRTQRFSFKPVELSKVTAHLKHIAKQEKIDIADDALELIAAHGEGSFRDSISLLDQVRNTDGKVTLQTVQQLLGIAPETLLNDLLSAVAAHDAPAAVKTLQAFQEQGFEPPMVAKQVGQLLRAQIVAGKADLPADTALALLAKLVDIPASRDPRLSLEIALLDVALAGEPAAKTMPAQVTAKPPTQVEPHPSSFQKKAKPGIPEPNPVPTPAEQPTATSSLDTTAWQQVLATIKQKHNTLFSIVRTVSPLFGPGELTLQCTYAFHKKRLSESRNKQVIIDTIKQVTGQEPAITFTIAENSTPKPSEPSLPPTDEQIHTVTNNPPKNDTIQNVSNIFGSAELLES